MDAQEFFRRAGDEFARRVKDVSDSQWALPTPCTEWDVRALVGHIVVEDAWVPPLMEGKTIAEVGDSLDGDLLGDDPRSAFERAYATAVDVFSADGAMDRTVHLSYGDRDAAGYAREIGTDHLIHAWDLARAVGGDERLDPELVSLVYKAMAPMEAELKKTGLFGETITAPPDADEQTKLLAILGRRA